MRNKLLVSHFKERQEQMEGLLEDDDNSSFIGQDNRPVVDRVEWSESETRFLIRMYAAEQSLMHSGKVKKKNVWKKIANRLAKEGCMYTANQCETKWKNLTAKYRRYANQTKDSKICDKTPFPFYDELKMVLDSVTQISSACNSTVVLKINSNSCHRADEDVVSDDDAQHNFSGYRVEWGDNDTKLLIKTYAAEKKLSRNGKVVRRFIWENIAMKMRSEGCKFNAIQCRSKWKNLTAAYRRHVNLAENSAGGDRRTFTFYNELSEICGNQLNVTSGSSSSIMSASCSSECNTKDNATSEDEVQNNVVVDRVEWSKMDTELLISLYSEQQELMNSGKMKKKLVWELIADKMRTNGYMYNAIQCQTKWKNLMAAFRRYIYSSGKSDNASRVPCPFYSELSEIYVNNQVNLTSASLCSLTDVPNCYNDAGREVIANKDDEIMLNGNDVEWTDDDIKFLISFYADEENLMHGGNVKEKLAWERISNKMKSKRSKYTSACCESKWKNLTETYKQYVDHVHKYGNSYRVSCPFYDELSEIYGYVSNPSPLSSASCGNSGYKTEDEIVLYDDDVQENGKQEDGRSNSRNCSTRLNHSPNTSEERISDNEDQTGGKRRKISLAESLENYSRLQEKKLILMEKMHDERMALLERFTAAVEKLVEKSN